MVPQKQILIVEDNDINRAMLYEILSEKYAVLEAENGQQALDILKQKKDSISLILLDVIMPVMDGYSFLARIREDAELSLIPVILMTQNSSEEDEVEGLARGATDFVPKPYRPQVILHRVASIIKLRETAAMVNQFQFDRLTGLYSKEFFYQKVRQRLLENPEKDYWIVCSNIENFKLFNDAFGPQSGDRLLMELAGIVQSTGGSDGLCGRFGADHFLCFQERTSAQRFLEAVEQENSPQIKSVVVRWGAYEVTDPFIHVEQMCDRALLAANSIKGQYDQYFAVYDDSLRSKLLREQSITDAMETALEQKQFLVYLQPKYSLKDDCMIGAEALVRWIHPVWGFISPGEFIPLFEKNGFIPRLDQYAWEHVCALLRDWKQRGYPLLPISVNISRSDVYQLNLVDTLLELTQKYGIDPKYLHLEITETAYADNPSQIITTVNQLRQLGFPIEMDDFGSGYSSLNMLSQMKLDVLKLDMKFVQNEISKPAEQSILDDVIAMAHRMKLGVVAEGIETLAQVKRLRGVGCDYAQGFFFAKPMPAAEFEALWENQRKTQGQKVEPAHRESSKRLLLVADEDDGYRQKVCMSFAAQYEVLEASDVHRAQACIQENRDVSVIILSMTLPDNGASMVMKMLREAPDLWRIPVVATIPNGEEAGMLSRALDADDFLCKRHPVFDLHKRVDHLVELVEAHRRERILKEEASRDYLTGLLNRRGLKAALDGLKKEDMPLATYLFDLDNLKITNDTYGHDVGDQMIMVFADLLRKQTRADDILCRYGGDEFLVVLKNMKTEAEAAAKGQFICQAFRDSMEAMSISMSCSAGIALCAEDENPSHSLIDHADRAMLRVKRENKGGCSLWRGDREEKQSS